MEVSSNTSSGLRFGQFEFDLFGEKLLKQGLPVRLERQPYQILVALLERPGQVVTREELRASLWPNGTYVDFDEGLNTAIKKLRYALGDSAENPIFIETVPRRGYRFIAPVASKLPESDELATPPSLRYPFLLAGIVLGFACMLIAFLWIRHRQAKTPEPEFQRLSFGRGMIRSARFAPDGQSVVYSAAWDGKPSQLFLTKVGSFESRPLGMEAEILAISPSGEMAVLLNQRFGIVSTQGTLALTSLTASAPRKMLDNVQDADWSPDGSKLVVTHYIGSGCALEFPPGKVLYETTGGTWLSHPRVSPRGDQIAFLEHPQGGDDDGFVEIVDFAGNKKVQSREFQTVEGLAWDPSGDAVWFSGREPGPSGPRALFKVTTAGQQRLVRREPGNLTVRDVSRSGQMVLTRDTLRGDVFGRVGRENKERELGWLDNSNAYDLSPDGSAVVLSVQGEAAGTGYAVYLRKTDGSSAVRLGDGMPRQFSPDGKWVLTSTLRPTPAPQLVLLPTGAGQPVSLTQDSIAHDFATLLPDGKRFLFEGNEPEHARRNWIQDVAGGKPLPITPEGTAGEQVSPDGKLLVAVDQEQKFWLYPMDGGKPTPLSGIESGEYAIRWSNDGKHLFVANSSIPATIYRVEVSTGRRQLVYKLAPSDLAGIWNIWPVLITPDGKTYVYSDYRILSDLYLASGLDTTK